MKNFKIVIGSFGFKMFLFLLASNLSGQVKIGDNPTNIDIASILELESTTGALVVSRVSNTQMLSISPLQGALIYNTDEQCIFYYNGAQWNNLCGATSGISFVDNGDGTFSLTDTNGSTITVNGPETISTLRDNGDGTYTYTDENSQETVIISG